MGALARSVYRAAHLLRITTLVRGCRAAHVPVLMYHGVCAGRVGGVLNCEGKHVAAEDFDRHLRFLKKHHRVIPLGEYALALRDGKPLPDHAAVLTLDDGYENNHSVAFPLLKKHGVPATVFVTADFVERGEPLWVDRLAAAFEGTSLGTWADPSSGTVYPLASPADKAGCYLIVKANLKKLGPADHARALGDILRSLGAGRDLPGLFAPLSPAQVREMAASGIVEIGSHCCRHLRLTTLGADEARHEVVASRERIATLAGRAVESFSYPNGDLSPAVMSLVESAGYSCAVAEGLRLNIPGRTSRFAVSRLALKGEDDDAAIAATLAGLRELGLRAAGLARR
ncbi:MAG: polysaccharide deacetylase family protein [Elusimicrobia bacterium]|nr:polysaccharide deacetylase family protein [Elusimicrobiota bacterium]